MLQRIAALIAAACVFAAAPVQATIIDPFNDGYQSLMVSPAHATNSGQEACPSSIGGYRDLALQWISGRTIYADVLTDPGYTGLSLVQGTGQAILTVTWNGGSSYSLGADLTGGNADRFLLDILEVTGAGVSLQMFLFTDADNASATTSIAVPAGTVGPFSIPYSSFAQIGTGGPASLEHVGAIVLKVAGAAHGSDITVSSLETATPEPSMVAIAICGLAAIGVGLGVRRSKNR